MNSERNEPRENFIVSQMGWLRGYNMDTSIYITFRGWVSNRRVQKNGFVVLKIAKKEGNTK